MLLFFLYVSVSVAIENNGNFKKMNPTFNYHFDPLFQYIRLCVADIFSWLQRLSLFIDFEARLCFYPFIVMLYF